MFMCLCVYWEIGIGIRVGIGSGIRLGFGIGEGGRYWVSEVAKHNSRLGTGLREE